MANDGIRVNLAADRLMSEAIAYAEPLAKESLLRRMLNDTKEYVPYRTGALSDSGTVSLPTSSIMFTEEYAPYAFEPIAPSGKRKVYTHLHNQKAGGNPMERATEELSDEWVQFYKQELIRYVNEWIREHPKRVG